MSPVPTGPGRRGVIAAAVVTGLLLVLGVAALVVGLRPAGGPPQPTAAAQEVTAPSPRPAAGAAPGLPGPAPATAAGPAPVQPAPPDATALDAASLPRSRPVALAIPSIGVSSSDIVDLGKQSDGTLEVPADYDRPGWYAEGPAPGQFGPAVLAGHVDSKTRPGVFYRLGALRPGDAVLVTRADGSQARFTVDRVQRYPKDQFPTTDVYGDTTHRAELRLITCGGDFDRRTGHYVDNVVAFAHLV